MLNIFTSLFRQITYERVKFSGGEINIKLNTIPIGFNEEIAIEAHLTSSDDIMELVLIVDALRRAYVTNPKIRLVCPYLPYARQDRVMNPGESLALKVMCSIINSLNFSSVEVWDVHSDVAPALLNNVNVVQQWQFVQRVPVEPKNTILVAPDAGAIKKTMHTTQTLGFLDMVRADKTRDVKNKGKITGTVVYSEYVGHRDFLIVDDICDGGRTFIELAKELRKLTSGHIGLYVTHGIFSKGFGVFDGLIDSIFVAKPFPNVDIANNDKLVKILNLKAGH